MNNPHPSSTGTGILEEPSEKPTLLSALAGVCQLHSLPPVEVPFAVDVAGTTSCQHGPPPFHRHNNNPRSFETFSTLTSHTQRGLARRPGSTLRGRSSPLGNLRHNNPQLLSSPLLLKETPQISVRAILVA
uniref:(northern house mosquito) hypothetical protein n=1 Tax=Culex pipiens TaxID=7175 RepID=A0A8D8B1G2_CULPI